MHGKEYGMPRVGSCLWLGHPVGLGSDAKEKGRLYV